MNAEDKPDDRLIAEVVDLQRLVARALRSTARPHWLELDLTMAQMKTMVVLADERQASIGRVAEVLGITLPTASHLVDRLVKTGLAVRAEDPTDRRRIRTELTPKGEELLSSLRQGQHRLAAWLQEMEPDDLEALARGLRALARIAMAAHPETASACFAESVADGVSRS